MNAKFGVKVSAAQCQNIKQFRKELSHTEGQCPQGELYSTSSRSP